MEKQTLSSKPVLNQQRQAPRQQPRQMVQSIRQLPAQRGRQMQQSRIQQQPRRVVMQAQPQFQGHPQQQGRQVRRSMVQGPPRVVQSRRPVQRQVAPRQISSRVLQQPQLGTPQVNQILQRASIQTRKVNAQLNNMRTSSTLQVPYSGQRNGNEMRRYQSVNRVAASPTRSHVVQARLNSPSRVSMAPQSVNARRISMASSMLNPVLAGPYKPFVPTFNNVPTMNVSTVNPYLRTSAVNNFRPSFNPYASVVRQASPVRTQLPVRTQTYGSPIFKPIGTYKSPQQTIQNAQRLLTRLGQYDPNSLKMPSNLTSNLSNVVVARVPQNVVQQRSPTRVVEARVNRRSPIQRNNSSPNLMSGNKSPVMQRNSPAPVKSRNTPERPEPVNAPQPQDNGEQSDDDEGICNIF